MIAERGFPVRGRPLVIAAPIQLAGYLFVAPRGVEVHRGGVFPRAFGALVGLVGFLPRLFDQLELGRPRWPDRLVEAGADEQAALAQLLETLGDFVPPPAQFRHPAHTGVATGRGRVSGHVRLPSAGALRTVPQAISGRRS